MNERLIYQDTPYRNSEGYADPTAYRAIRNCSRNISGGFMPIVLIYSTEHEPEEKLAKEATCLAIRSGCIPIAPQLTCIDCIHHGTHVDQVNAGILTQILLTKCNELWICGDRYDAIVPRLIEKAVQRGMRKRFFSSQMKEASNV